MTNSASLLLPQRRQHTVSRVVLRRFARRNIITVFDRQANLIHSKGLKGVFHAYLDQYDPWLAEQRWAAVEARMPRVYRALDRRVAQQDPAMLAALRDLIALHWVRTPGLRQARDQIRDKVKAENISKLAARPDLLAQGLMQKTGLVPASNSELEWLNVRAHDQVLREIGERLHSESMARHFDWAQNRLADWHLEILYSDHSDFVIGDAPVITLKPRHEGVGPHQGVALGDAVQVFMPVSPRILVAMSPTPGQAAVDDGFVDLCNSLQVRGFTRWLGCHPDGPSAKAMRDQAPDTVRRRA